MMQYLLYFLAIVSLSQSPNWVKFSGAPALELGFWRLFFASLIWLLVWLASRHPKVAKLLQEAPHAEWDLKSSRKSKIWAVAAGFLFFVHLWAFHYAAQHTKVANLMILFASNPIFTSALTILFFKEKWHSNLLLSYLLALGGLIYLFSGDISFSTEQFNGNLAALAAAVLFSGYIIASRQARKHYSTVNFSLFLYPIASTCFLLYILASGSPLWPESSRVWFSIAGLTVFSTLLGHSLFSYLLKHMNINFMSFGKLIEPILSATMAYFLFAEPLTLRHLVAFALVTSGVGLYIKANR